MTSSSGIISQLIGKWQQVSSDNFDAFLASAGRNYYCIIACMSVLTSQQRTDVPSAVHTCRVLGPVSKLYFKCWKKERGSFCFCIVIVFTTFVFWKSYISVTQRIYGLMMLNCAVTTAGSLPWNQQPDSEHSLTLVTQALTVSCIPSSGITGERAEKARGPQPPEQWSVDAGGDNITSSRLFPDKTLSVTFKLNKDFLDPTIGDGKYVVSLYNKKSKN